MVGSGLVPYLIVLLAFVSDSWQYVHSVWMSEMDALAIKKLTVGHLHLEPASAIYCGSNYKLLTWHTLLNT